MEGSSGFGTFVAEVVIALVLIAILLITLRTMFMISMLTWAPLRQLWRRVRGQPEGDGDRPRAPTDAGPPPD